MKKTLLTYLMSLIAFVTYAQTGQVSGRIVDAETGEGLFGANAAIKGTAKGAMADFDGAFTITGVEAGEQTLVISYVGYEAFEKKFTIKAGESVNLGALKLEGGALNMDAIEVLADVAIDRKTPVAVSSIKPALIQEKLGTQEFPEILKSTPGVYATKASGGFGDARVNIRGFDSDNVGVLINGVPVNDMEGGKVYWSNWAGLSDVTQSMQVQRGLGASKLAISSVGGTINILTKSTDVEKGGSFSSFIGNNGYLKNSATVSTGLMDNGWAVTLSGSKTTGDGYILGTEFEGYSYFAAIAKRINDKHEIVLTGFGAPQTHNQRFPAMTMDMAREKGVHFNPSFGYRNGEVYTSAYNFYHKPQISLNHYWNVNRDINVSTSLYLSKSSGGGRRTEGKKGSWLDWDSDGTPTSDALLTPEGYIDFDRAIALNGESNEGSLAYIANSMNSHDWYGFLSTVNADITDEISVTGGLDGRYYVGYHGYQIADLLGGKYVLNDSDINRDPNTRLGVGDWINYRYTGQVVWGGVFGQAEYSNDVISAFVSAAGSNTSYRKTSYLTYKPGENQSDWINFIGWSAKGGANYNLTDVHNVFANVGYFTRAPFFRAAFKPGRETLEFNEGALNEKVFSTEVGYGFRTSYLTANVNVYRTLWMDKSFVRSIGTYTANILGIDALHQGIEVDFVINPIDKLDIRGMASIGDWKWNSNVNADVYDDNDNLVGTVNVISKGLYVGNSAQLTAAIGANYQVFNSFKIGADFNYYGKNYSDFDVTRRNDPLLEGVQAWKIPDYYLLDINAKYDFDLGKGLKATIYGKVNNLLDVEYVADATDRSRIEENAEGVNQIVSNPGQNTVFYGFGRTWSTGIKVKF